MNVQIITSLLDSLDVEAATHNSTLNHHVNGLDYLCLHRSRELTVKLYLMEEPKNPNSGFLVHPHAHRYGFETTVLFGAVRHVRFHKESGRQWQEFRRNPDTGQIRPGPKVNLIQQADLHKTRESYYVEPFEIHTLHMVSTSRPTLLGLIQTADVRDDAEMFLPTGMSFGDLPSPESRRPSVTEVIRLRNRCLELI